MSNAIEDNLVRGRLEPFESRVPLQEDIKLRHFGDPTPVGFAVELNGAVRRDEPFEPSPGYTGAGAAGDECACGAGHGHLHRALDLAELAAMSA